MVFCVIADGTLKNLQTLPECDVAVFGFNGLGEVDYEQELKGASDKFEDAVRFSKTAGCGVLCGCYTKSRGVIRKSVSVADKGKLLGISDMNYVLDGEDFKSGAGLGVYSVGGYKIGLCIENDLLFPDAFKALALCGCNAVVAFMEEVKNVLPALIIRTYSYLYGIPVVMCAGKTAFFSEVTGELATSSQPVSYFDVSPCPQYRKVTMRTKGLFNDFSEDY